jgi:chitinase
MLKIRSVRWRIILLVCFAFIYQTFGESKKSVGYYPAWNRYTFSADKIEFEHLTHITHAFIWPKSDGSLDKYSTIPYPDLVDKTHQAGKKILISVGGWGNCTYFSAILTDSAKRQVFLNNLVSFCDENGYDGVDLDWEYLPAE